MNEIELLNKIDNGIELSEKELKMLVWEYEIDASYGENRRWSRSVTTIVQLGDRYFAIEWEEGLTEMQENEFYEQPYEVEKTEKTVVVTEWKAKKKEEE